MSLQDKNDQPRRSERFPFEVILAESILGDNNPPALEGKRTDPIVILCIRRELVPQMRHFADMRLNSTEFADGICQVLRQVVVEEELHAASRS
ncbi:protein of unknown function [Ralstonia solanacearum CMR15]|nr:protein of unknown function [Ralstonia solanacearum CMR15]